MGTRSLTIIRDRYDRHVATLYRQYDGYPSGHGVALAEFGKGHTVSNTGAQRRTMGDGEGPIRHNGIGCWAAALVCHFKGQPGNASGAFYLEPEGVDAGEEYRYTVQSRPDGMDLKIYDVNARRYVYADPLATFGPSLVSEG